VDDFSQRIPDMLESATERVRSLTVDRVARFIKIAALGLVITILVALALVFLFVGLGRIVNGLIAHACSDCSWSMPVTYAALGGLFLLFGALVWSARTKRKDPEESSE
jgi:H+/Cl- antiporter ClcA